MKCPNCSKIIKKTDTSCRFCGNKIEIIKEEPVNKVVYQVVESKVNKWLVFSVGILSFLVLLETSFGVWYFLTKDDNKSKKDELTPNDIPITKQLPVNNYYPEETFVFEGFELNFSKNYSFEILDNKYSTYNGKDVIKIPVEIKNVTSEINSFNIYRYRIYGPNMDELDEVAQYFDNGLFYIKDLDPNERSTSYLYFLYDGDGKYLIKFENDNSIKNIVLNIKKR